MTKKILVANDDEDVMKIIKARLKNFDYEIIVANNGQEAINLAKQSKPDVIVIDDHMPVFNGDVVIRR